MSGFLNDIKKFGNDNLEFIIKAAHFAGILESDHTIEVSDWDDLIKFIVEYVKWYIEDEKLFDYDFFEELAKRLNEKYPCERG